MHRWATRYGFLAVATPTCTQLRNVPAGLRVAIRKVFSECFANLYADFAEAIASRITGKAADPLHGGSPGVRDGLWGQEFVEATLASSRAGGAWTPCHSAGLTPIEAAGRGTN